MLVFLFAAFSSVAPCLIILDFLLRFGPDPTVCAWLFPTENCDYSGGCGGLTGTASSHNRVVSRIEKMRSCLTKRRAVGE